MASVAGMLYLWLRQAGPLNLQSLQEHGDEELILIAVADLAGIGQAKATHSQRRTRILKRHRVHVVQLDDGHVRSDLWLAHVLTCGTKQTAPDSAEAQLVQLTFQMRQIAGLLWDPLTRFQ